MLRCLKQICALCLISFRTIPRRRGSYIVVVLGVSGVVAVLLSVLAISGGLVRVIGGSGHADRAIVLQQNAVSESASSIERSAAARILSAPGIKRGSDGRAIGSTDVLASMRITDPSNKRPTNVLVRGVSSQGLALRSEMRVVEGRSMRPGFYELMIGRDVRERFKALNLGNRVRLRDAEWTIVGVFSSAADLHEMEILTDSEMLLSATHRNAVNSVVVLLERQDSLDAFRAAVAADVSPPVKVYRESDYYKLQSEPLKDAWSFVAYVVSGIMALGAMFGAANTMYSAVSARTVELATLRALGFGSGAVVVSVLIEAMIFAILGALLGVAIVWALFSGHTFSARLGSGHVAAQLSLNATLALLGVGWGCAISVLGALVPAMQVARQSIAQAIRAS